MREMVEKLRVVVTQIATSSRTRRAAEQISAPHRCRWRTGREAQSSSTDETSATMVQMAAQMQLLARNAEGLAASVDETSASIQQMSATLVQTAQNGETLLQSVDEAHEPAERDDREHRRHRAAGPHGGRSLAALGE